MPEATQSPPDLIEDEVSESESEFSDIVDGYQSLRCCISSLDGLDNQMSLLWDMKSGG